MINFCYEIPKLVSSHIITEDRTGQAHCNDEPITEQVNNQNSDQIGVSYQKDWRKKHLTIAFQK